MCHAGRTLLILDDESSIRTSLAFYFEDRGWQVRAVECAEDALAVLDRERIDGAIVDIRLGGMTGDEFIRESLKRNLQVVFVVCTGSAEYRLPKDLSAAPWVCRTVFKKPVTDMELMEREIKNILETAANRTKENDGNDRSDH